MNVISWGGGVNSTAMIIGMAKKKLPVDLILFADPGGELPATYKFRKNFNKWLRKHNLPEIKTLYYTNENGDIQTLEEECLKYKTLPAPCFGYKNCSVKYKTGVVNKFCNNYQPCGDKWAKGEKVNRFIGYDAGEWRRKENAVIPEEYLRKYDNSYPLIAWGWHRQDCIKAIEAEGLPIPPKSACFFCPNTKKHEIFQLYKENRDLYERAIAIEKNGIVKSHDIKGLGRAWSWEDLIEADKRQVKMDFMEDIYIDDKIPCGCFD